MLLTCEEMRIAEDRVFSTGVSAESLMEKAGLGIAEAVRQFFPVPGQLIVVGGKGHNAGDALVAARHLIADGWEVAVRFAFPVNELRPLSEKKLLELDEGIRLEELDSKVVVRGGPLVVLDGLLGIGAGGELRGRIREACLEINRLRSEAHAIVIAVDIPTGLNGDTGEPDSAAVMADYTFTIAAGKRGLVADRAINHVGRIVLIPLEELTPDSDGKSSRLADSEFVRSLLPVRDFDTHKGEAGRVGIIAGSVGLSGAARLCSAAAVCGGAGLVTLFVPEAIWPQMAVACAPEVMVRPIKDYAEVAAFPADALGVGPGLGDEVPDSLIDLLLNHQAPVVIDADALNAIARRGVAQIGSIKAPRLLTPHPGEMARLQEGKRMSRVERACIFASEYPVSLLLKGARTINVSSDMAPVYNTTGSPGMASGGMGDVLTGLSTALIAQGMNVTNAGIAGSWLLGMAAELAIISGNESVESLSATSVMDHIGEAFENCRYGCY